MQARVFFSRWWQRHFEFQTARVAVEGRSNAVWNTHARLQTSLLMRFLGQSVCIWWWCVSAARATVFQSFHPVLKQQQNFIKIMFSCIPFPVWPYPPKIMEKLFYTGKLYGLTGMQLSIFPHCFHLWPIYEWPYVVLPFLFEKWNKPSLDWHDSNLPPRH